MADFDLRLVLVSAVCRQPVGGERSEVTCRLRCKPTYRLAASSQALCARQILHQRTRYTRATVAILQTGGKKGDWLLSFAGILILYGVTGVIRNQQRVS